MTCEFYRPKTLLINDVWVYKIFKRWTKSEVEKLNKLKINNRKRADIEDYLDTHSYPKKQTEVDGKIKSNYDYLIKMPIWNLTYEKKEELLKEFWQVHDPTQGMRQGNDRGSQYRSAIFTYSEAQSKRAEQSKAHYQSMLEENGYPSITTEIKSDTEFYYAEDYHQQYLAKNPDAYCGLGGAGVCY